MMAGEDTRRGWRFFLPACIAAGLLGAYALPLQFPAPTLPVSFLTQGWRTIERIFPGVDADAVLLRLACLFTGAAVFAWMGAARVGPNPPPPSREGDGEANPAELRLLVSIGIALCLVAAAAPLLPRSLQLAFLGVALSAPLVVSRRGRGPGATWSTLRDAAWSPSALLATIWFFHRLFVSIGSPRSADGLDYLDGYLCYEKAAVPAFNVLTGSCWDGYTTISGILHGQGLFGWGPLPLNLPLVQAVSAAWTAVSVVLVARVVARHLGSPAATVATAVFLWSPIVLLRPLVPPPFTYTTVIALLVTVVDGLGRRVSPARAAALGSVFGLASHIPNLVLLLPCFALVPLRPLWRSGRSGLAALLFFVATALPGANAHLAMLKQVDATTSAAASWTAMEAVYSGRVAPSLAEGTKGTGTARVEDVAIGLALSPFAVARASLRLWGDTVIEPFGAALAAVGLFAAFAAARRAFAARAILVFTFAAMLPGLASSYDRVHPTRVEIGLTAALLAAWGFLTLVSRAPAAMRGHAAALVVAAVVAVSGTRLFDVVTPPLLHPSAAGLALRAGAALDHPVGWSPGVSGLSLPYMRVLSFQLADGRVFGWNPSAVHRRLPEPESPVVLWTPGEQMDRRVSRVLCEERAGRRLYELSDPSGTTRLFAAFREDIAEPRSTDEVRWTPKTCDDTLMTDAVVANRAIDEAAALVADGRPDEALGLLKEAATATVAQPRLYFPIASLLAARSEERAAEQWAALACRITQGSYYEACALAASLRDRATPG